MSDVTQPPLGGRYELRQRLGASGSAEVLLAHDRQLDRAVAVKVLSPELSRDPAIVARFRQAATAAATLHGPNVVTVYDWAEDPGRAYVAMELVDGESLADRVSGGARLGVDQAAATGIGIADALDVAHRAGQVHGSLTPRDVLMARDGTVKVTDFGTAAAGLASAGSSAAERAAYAAPEQLQGGAATPASDLYALGVVLSEAVAGVPPFTGDPVTVTRRKLDEHAVPPSMSAPGVPPAFDAIVARLLERDPARRYGSAAEVSRDLARLRETMATPAAAPTQQMARPVAATALPVTVPPHDEGRSATPWIIAAIVLLLLIIGGIVVWAVTRDDDSKAEQVVVPAVVGQRVAEAQAAITDAGLSPSTVNELTNEFAEGIVFSQAPTANTKARKGSVVVLKVSAGPSTTTSTSTSSTSTTSTSTTSTSTSTSTTTTTVTTPQP